MKNIELFNRNLNQSSNESNEQEMFKKQIDLLLNSSLNRIKEKKLAVIIGAGKMNDFSLSFFVRKFDKTVVTDIDLLTVNETIKYERFSKKELERLERIRIEYTGFEKNHFFNDFKERIVNCQSYDKLEKVIKSKLDGLENYRFLKEYNNRADFMYVSPIFTQLVYNQLLRECSVLRENRYPEHFIKYLEEILLDEMIVVIDRFNNNLVNTLKDEGILFVLSDVFQVDIGSEFHMRISHGIKNFDVMEEIYSGYQQKYGTGLGDYGLINLDDKLTPQLSRWLIWPYDDEKEFVVKLKIYKK